MQFPAELLNQCWFLTGATASGKTAVSLELAERLDAEIIALDSMTLYRKMDIGTAKPSISERLATPHHLFDVIDPWEEFSVAEYLKSARQVAEEIVQRHKTPLFVGGAGLYLRSLLRGVFNGPAADWELRKKWETLASSAGNQAVHDLLAQCDPPAAARLHVNDLRRVIRALEVFELTGIPLSAQQNQLPVAGIHKVFALMSPRDWLAERIERRLMQMVQQGLVAENLRLMDLERSLSHTARQALGYKEILDWLETLRPEARHPELSLPEAVFITMRDRTRQFAKRQETWFRNLEECRQIPIDPEDNPVTIARQILNAAENRS